MFERAPATLTNFTDSWHRPDGVYSLLDVKFEIRDPSTAVFSAIVEAPPESSPWVRCWVSNAIEGTLAQAEQSEVTPGAEIRLNIELTTESVPELACIRIESAPLATEHTLHVRLCKGETYFLGDLRFQLDSVDSLREMLANIDDEMRAQLSPAWLDMVANATEPIAWIHGFAVHDRNTGDRVGSGGFKGPPVNGEVEIAYGIDEPFRGKGFATTVATALTQYAFGQTDDVKMVIAHTLPEQNASTSVLTKCGFTNVGEVTDPDDGQVWRWEFERKSC